MPELAEESLIYSIYVRIPHNVFWGQYSNYGGTKFDWQWGTYEYEWPKELLDRAIEPQAPTLWNDLTDFVFKFKWTFKLKLKLVMLPHPPNKIN